MSNPQFTITITLKREEIAAIIKAAEHEGISKSAWCRRPVIQALRTQQKTSNRKEPAMPDTPP
jgi:hypothetical protein